VWSLRIGIHLASLHQPFTESLQTAARLGADAVEIDARGELRQETLSHTGLRHLRKMLDDLRLKVCAVGFQTRRGYNVVDDLEQRIEATKRAMDLAYALGSVVVVNQIGRVPEDAAGGEWDLLVQSLSDIGRHGQKCGALLAARTGTECGAALARLIDALPAGSLAVDFDPGQLIVNGFSAEEALACLGQHIQHVHARDAVRDLARGRGLEVELGRGSVDWPTLLGTLDELKYRGYLTIERREARDPVSEIGNAVQFLRGL
jgi:sugar phosphate isomerase/epimerase